MTTTSQGIYHLSHVKLCACIFIIARRAKIHKKWTFWCHELGATFQYNLFFCSVFRWIITHGTRTGHTQNKYFSFVTFPVSSFQCATEWSWKAKSFCNKWTLEKRKKRPMSMLFRSHRKINHRGNGVWAHTSSNALHCVRSIGEKLCQYDLVACTRNKSFIQHTKKHNGIYHFRRLVSCLAIF